MGREGEFVVMELCLLWVSKLTIMRIPARRRRLARTYGRKRIADWRRRPYDARMGDLLGKNILIVEDEYVLAAECVTALTGAGANVMGPVATCGAAWEILHRQKVDAAVVDIRLADAQKAYPLAELLRDKCIPFLFATAYDRSEVPREFAGRAFLAKPFSHQQLVAAIESVLDDAG
jgi:CheY-like chemotaxis protein